MLSSICGISLNLAPLAEFGPRGVQRETSVAAQVRCDPQMIGADLPVMGAPREGVIGLVDQQRFAVEQQRSRTPAVPSSIEHAIHARIMGAQTS